MNKILILLVMLVLSLVITGCINTPTGGVTCPQIGCRLTATNANFQSEVKDADGNGCLTDCAADIWVKNVENQPTRVKVTADCWTTKEKYKTESETFWLQPGQEHTFHINLKVGLTENWKCDNFAISSDKINSCEAYIIG